MVEIPISKFSLVHKEGAGKPSQAYCDVSLQFNPSDEKGIELENITFQNYYTASIRMLQLQGSAYVTVLDRMELMRDPFSENDSQTWKSVSVKDFNHNYMSRKPFRITLIQPCSYWQKFEIRNLRAFGRPVGGRSIGSDTAALLPTPIDFYKSGFSQLIGLDLVAIQTAAQEQSNMFIPQSPVFSSYSESKRTGKMKEKKKEKRSSISAAAYSSDQQSSNTDEKSSKTPDDLLMTP